MHVWKNPNDIFNKILALSESEMILVDPSSDNVDASAAEIANGNIPDDATRIPVGSIGRVLINEASDTDTEVRVVVGGQSVDKRFDAENSDVQREIFQTLKTALGDRFEESSKTHSAGSALLFPLGFAAVIALLTWILVGAARQVAEGDADAVSGRHGAIKRLFVWILDLLGPTGVLVVGALLLTICAIAAVMRFRNPPSYRILEVAAGG